jgi:lysophospholipase L1-like esterase
VSHRVAVLGNSVPILVVPPRKQREEGTFPERLQQLLDAQGLDVEVRNESRLFDMLPGGWRRFQEQLVPWAPDVLVVNYGVIEMQPNVLPTWLNRHLTTETVGGKGPVALYKRRVVPVLWPPARTYQQAASHRAGTRTWRLPPGRLAAELRRLIEVARQEQMLVVVNDVHEPGDRMRHFVPGIERRHAILQEVLADVVDGFADPDVRLLPVSQVSAKLGQAAGLPDGLHLSSAGHLGVAELLADEIGPWLASLPC